MRGKETEGAVMKLKAVNHLAFITNDLNSTIRFWRDLLGLRLEAGIGHEGYRHYFFKLGEENQIAFFEYEEAAPMVVKFPGERTGEPLGFDHVSFTVDTVEELFGFKDRLEAAGFKVHGAVDHGIIWSIYFFDPNNIPLEISWDTMELTDPPAMDEVEPMAIDAEGAKPQPGHWPDVTDPTPRDRFTAHGGNAFTMRETFIREGIGRLKPDFVALMEEQVSAKSSNEAAE
jgi:catechol 2,3-dioxygenase-like lactoylglutathione lyase family enzyme